MPITFPFYTLGTATPLTKNTINSVAGSASVGGIRDYLLNKNLFPTSQPLAYQTALNTMMSVIGGPKIGEPVVDTSINGDLNVIPDHSPVATYGVTYKNGNLVNNNQFKNTDTVSLNQLTDLPDIVAKTPALGQIYNFGTVDFPNGANSVSYPEKPDENIAKYGLLAKTTYANLKTLATIKNLYNVTSQQVDISDYIDSELVYTQYNEMNKNVVASEGYLDQYGALNQGGQAGIETANIIGSIANGGLGVAKGGLVTNFDVRASLVGRVLGATGSIKDTNIGIIGGQQLVFALANNAAFNVQQTILGKLNIKDNVLSLIKGNGLAGFRPNYQITVPSSGVGKLLEGAASILGFTLPRSFIEPEGSIFANENGNIENIKRANELLKHTGKGQFVSLIKNAMASIEGINEGDSTSDEELTPFRSGYAPSYARGDKESEINGDNLYAYSDGKGHLINPLSNSKDNTDKASVIPDLSYSRKSGFESFEGDYSPSRDNNIKFVAKTWTSTSGGTVNVSTNSQTNFPLPTEKKNLLNKTQKLFNSSNMRTIVSTKGIASESASQIQTTNAGGISKGSAVLKKELFTPEGDEKGINTDVNGTYARAWTTFDRYDSVSKLIRHRGLDATVPYRNQMEGSVLDDNGFVKISPYTNVVDDPKKFMFSIENLAWNDEYFNLLPCERGSGDLLTGKKGRIMWFPPYDIQFSENSSVEWDTNKFIGRGESVYTYSNTERSGTLSFKVVVDHPTYANTFEGNDGPSDNYVASFFAGEISPDALFSNRLTSYQLDEMLTAVEPMSKVIDDNYTSLLPPSVFYYFPNDVFTYYPDYENGDGNGIGYVAGQLTSKRNYKDDTDFGLNKEFVFDGQTYADLTSLAAGIATFLLKKGNEAIVINVKGWASIPGQNTANDALASKRADTIIAILKTNMASVKDIAKRLKKIKNITEEGGCEAGDENQTGKTCKEARKAEISFEIDYNLIPDSKDVYKKKTQKTTTITDPFYGECRFFEKLKETDPFVFDKFRDKIKYFHPAFHSTTPEGLNSRLTFLLQCTRQGPTLEKQGANNLAFGRPPVCILRIGDFYNTKIIIDSIGIDYEPLVWDLNPEGIGVQPMIANVNMSFKFIGGSTLLGPINKLQNALSFNYFANTHVYDVRADYLAKIKNPLTAKKANSDYELLNVGHDTYNDNLNNGVKVSDPTLTVIPEIDQTKSSDKATDGVQETLVEEPMFYIGGIQVQKVVQEDTYWDIHLKLLAYSSAPPNYELVTNLADYNVQTIWAVNEGFSLQIRQMDGNEVYTYEISEPLGTEINTLQKFLIGNPEFDNHIFRIPKRNVTLGTVTQVSDITLKNEKVKNTFNKDTGISDSIGSEKFILSVIAKKPGSGGGLYEETARINVKLK